MPNTIIRVALFLFVMFTLATAQERELKLSPQASQALNELQNASTGKTQIVLFGPADVSPPAGVRLAFAATPTCASVPPATAATSFIDNASYMSQEIAASLKITWIVSANAEANKKSQVFIRDYAKFARCRASDNSGNVLYGANLRATVLVDSTDVAAGANFAVAAASATVKQRNVQVQVSGNGFQDAAVGQNASSAQSATFGGLTVDTYAEFKKFLGQAYNAAVISPIGNMQPIGFEPDLDTTDFVKGLATTYALDRIAQGYGCEDAVKHFNKKFPDKVMPLTETAIRNTYQLVAKGCSAASPLARATAEAMIGGQRIVDKD